MLRLGPKYAVYKHLTLVRVGSAVRIGFSIWDCGVDRDESTAALGTFRQRQTAQGLDTPAAVCVCRPASAQDNGILIAPGDWLGSAAL